MVTIDLLLSNTVRTDRHLQVCARIRLWLAIRTSFEFAREAEVSDLQNKRVHAEHKHVRSANVTMTNAPVVQM